MEVKYCIENTCLFGEIRCGECFEYNGRIYMRIDIHCSELAYTEIIYPPNCVGFHTNMLYRMEKNTVVTPVECSLVITRKGGKNGK